MTQKDYYQILNVHPTCTMLEIKKAYRKLALQYHPDTNNNHPLLEEKFREIKIAYEILSNVESRKKYHSSVYFENYIKEVTNIHDILLKVAQLKNYVMNSNTDKIDQVLLLNYLLDLLSSSNVVIIMNSNNESIKNEIFESIILSSKILPYSLFIKVSAILEKIFLAEYTTIELILKQKKRNEWWNNYKILFAVIAALLFCLLIALIG
jgi:preprotein translocase subunit Sec63